jgi:hypothetical protein
MKKEDSENKKLPIVIKLIMFTISGFLIAKIYFPEPFGADYLRLATILKKYKSGNSSQKDVQENAKKNQESTVIKSNIFMEKTLFSTDLKYDTFL